MDNGGNASRDFIFVEDMARGLVSCVERGDPGQAYNLASGVETTILDLAKTINDITGNTTPVDLQPARDWDRSGKRFGATEKSRDKLGFSADTSIRQGLEQTISWTREHQELITRTMSSHDILMAQFNRDLLKRAIA